MNQIRSRINALRRKMALEISVASLRPLADDFCLEWSVAQTDRKPPPDDHTFIRRVADAGFRLPTFIRPQIPDAVPRRKRRSRRRASPPTNIPDDTSLGASPKTSFPASSILGALLPWAAVRGLVVLSDDPPAEPVPARA